MAQLNFEFKGKTFSLEGMSSDIYIELAKFGAKALLKNRKDLDESWERIKKGNFGRKPPKKFPKVVLALSKMGMNDGDLVKTYRQWKKTPETERKRVLRDPDVRIAMIELERDGPEQGRGPEA